MSFPPYQRSKYRQSLLLFCQFVDVLSQLLISDGRRSASVILRRFVPSWNISPGILHRVGCFQCCRVCRSRVLCCWEGGWPRLAAPTSRAASPSDSARSGPQPRRKRTSCRLACPHYFTFSDTSCLFSAAYHESLISSSSCGTRLNYLQKSLNIHLSLDRKSCLRTASEVRVKKQCLILGLLWIRCWFCGYHFVFLFYAVVS